MRLFLNIIHYKFIKNFGSLIDECSNTASISIFFFVYAYERVISRAKRTMPSDYETIESLGSLDNLFSLTTCQEILNDLNKKCSHFANE